MMPTMATTVIPAPIPSLGGTNISATFSVPGRMSIPSDHASHNVTITELTLDAKMTWVSVPKKDTRVHLSVRRPSMLGDLDGY